MLCLSGFKLYSRWVPLKLAQYPAILMARNIEYYFFFFPVNVIFFRGPQRRFPPKYIEKSF